MNGAGYRPGVVWSAVALAAVLWFVTFSLGGPSFWIKIGVSTAILAAVAVREGTIRANALSFDRKAVIQGLLAAAGLYLVFWAGKEASTLVLPFASGQIGAIYDKGQGFPTVAIFFLLLFVTGPCEELFWRGFLQRRLMERYGRWGGFLLCTLVYAGVHVFSFNFMLIGAAAVAGAFWGLLYMKLARLDSVIISHSLWSAVIFAVAPMS
ncbi:MAG TPA: CPBP family intramembrane metalloprotease [Deltaproteobacteria bacterium]|nr:CPBP family intramembrane metalloprotease [Deltaproteobacteria bacterium]HPR55952.1 CPBP family intramembrane metalloprotease [Deltaproteobacteria bacterium]HXK47830.1 CPBP family intramembrane metalloprotease [Deltaproteobacteria bacterium]